MSLGVRGVLGLWGVRGVAAACTAESLGTWGEANDARWLMHAMQGLLGRLNPPCARPALGPPGCRTSCPG